MQKQNLIDLTSGENRILLTGEDVGIFMGKVPMFRIPMNTMVHNAHIEILTPFIISTGVDSKTTAKSRLDFELGISSDDDFFIKRITGDVSSIQNPCSGEYFIESKLLKVPTVVYLNIFSLCRPWIVSENLNNTKHSGGGGSESFDTAIVYGGTQTITEIYDRQVWSIGNKNLTYRTQMGGCGGISSSVLFGGYKSSPITYFNTSEKYNGVTWSASGNINYARRWLVGVGNATSAVGFCGRNENSNDTYYTATEEYNGTTWTTSIEANIGRERHSGCGSLWDAVSFGGRCSFSILPYVEFSEHYNGTSWYIGPDITVPRYYGSGTGPSNSALFIGGLGTSGQTNYSEEYNGTIWYPSNEILMKKYTFASGSVSGFAMNMGGYSSYQKSSLIETEKQLAIPTAAIKPFGTMIVNLTIL